MSSESKNSWNPIPSHCRHLEDEQRQQELMEELDAQLEGFSPARALTRNGTWVSMATLMLALAAKLASSGIGAVPLLSTCVVLTGVVWVVALVLSFRKAYRPMLAKASFAR